MDLTYEQIILIATGIVIPLVGLYLKRTRKSTPKNHDDIIIDELQRRIAKLEDSAVQNQIDIEDARRELAYIKGRLEH